MTDRDNKSGESNDYMDMLKDFYKELSWFPKAASSPGLEQALLALTKSNPPGLEKALFALAGSPPTSLEAELEAFVRSAALRPSIAADCSSLKGAMLGLACSESSPSDAGRFRDAPPKQIPMTTKFVKVMFRAKGGPRHAFKVFTNVRMAGKRHPVQIHLCYVPDREHLTEQDQEKIQKALEEQWRERLNKKRVRILLDWTDAKEKWAKRKTPKKWKVDRTNAKKQIDAWMKDDNSDPIEAYTHLKPESQSAAAWFGIDEKSFKERFLELSMQLDDKTPGADFKDVTDWWENLEAPRLLEAFARYAKREDSVFGPRSYLAYLGRNIGVGYASKQFLRAHPNAVARLQTIRAHLDDIDI